MNESKKKSKPKVFRAELLRAFGRKSILVTFIISIILFVIVVGGLEVIKIKIGSEGEFVEPVYMVSPMNISSFDTNVTYLGLPAEPDNLSGDQALEEVNKVYDQVLERLDIAIDMNEKQLASGEGDNYFTKNFMSEQLYKYKKIRTAYKSAKTHHYTSMNYRMYKENEIPLLLSRGSKYMPKSSAYKIVFNVIRIPLLLLAVFLINGIFLSEFEKGTLRLQLVRPVNRDRLLRGKIFAVITLLFLFILVFAGLSFIYSRTFKGEDRPAMAVLIPEFPVQISVLAQYLLPIVSYLLQTIFIVGFTLFLSSFTKRKGKGLSMVLPILYIFFSGAILKITQIFGIQFLDIGVAMTFLETMYVAGGVYSRSSNVFVGAFLYCVLCGIFYLQAHMSFRKKDIL